MNNIDKLVYVNLDHRTDRRTELERALDELGINPDIVERHSAVHNPTNAIGCAESHIQVLERAIAKGYKHVLVLEDDFEPLVSKEIWHEQLNDFFLRHGTSYDVALLSYHALKSSPLDDIVNVAEDVQTGSGYLIKGAYIQTLLDHWREGLEHLKRTGRHWDYAPDQYWKSLQRKDKWYCFKTRLGKQRPGYSDLAYGHVDYGY
jgi:glycosyl transferase family 25